MTMDVLVWEWLNLKNVFCKQLGPRSLGPISRIPSRRRHAFDEGYEPPQFVPAARLMVVAVLVELACKRSTGRNGQSDRTVWQ